MSRWQRHEIGPMTEIVRLEDFKTKTLEKRVSALWKKRFGEDFSHETGLSDISDKSLLFLCRPGETSAQVFYELVMGVLKLGGVAGFSCLKQEDQLYVMEIHLFLSDLCRFEMMHRLGWIKPVGPCGKSLVELIRHYGEIRNYCRQNPPRLSEDHPDYHIYKNLHERDREGFIRRLLPAALDIFQRKIH